MSDRNYVREYRNYYAKKKNEPVTPKPKEKPQYLLWVFIGVATLLAISRLFSHNA